MPVTLHQHPKAPIAQTLPHASWLAASQRQPCGLPALLCAVLLDVQHHTWQQQVSVVQKVKRNVRDLQQVVKIFQSFSPAMKGYIHYIIQGLIWHLSLHDNVMGFRQL